MTDDKEKEENKGKSKSASVVDTAENIKKLRKIVDEETAKDSS